MESFSLKTICRLAERLLCKHNFTIEDLKEAVRFANAHNAKIHVTVNIVPEEDDMSTLDEYLLSLSDAGVHAIIVST